MSDSWNDDEAPRYRRPALGTISGRLHGPRRFIQVLAGPRQTGKTTIARQALSASGLASHYASADEPGLRDPAWLAAQWDIGRMRAREDRMRGGLLVLDEVQKIPGWSEAVKRLWDEDTAAGTRLRVLVLGSSPLLVQTGLTESLAGRFEVIRIGHWSFGEMRAAFGWDLDRYVAFGGYPGAAPLTDEPGRWADYIMDSLVETTISRDVLLLTRVDKPALLRQLFRLGCDYSGQILSYQKMVGQLQDAGNTTTLAHYLELLSGAGMITGLQKFTGSKVRQRSSSPKLLALNTALMTAPRRLSLEEARRDRDLWGRLVETAVGAHLVNSQAGSGRETFYWRERNREVDYVVSEGGKTTVIEIASGRKKGALPGMGAFEQEFGPARKLLVGAEGMRPEEFFLTWG